MTYITAQSSNLKLKILKHEVAELTAQQWQEQLPTYGRAMLEEWKITLDKDEPDFRQ